ncbi:low molecular weight phosphotyrosine protein phosphatase [Vibrio makurazakiensis]|uniref:arsenate reductase/protein-tyrosine-phosphatase family protein n=1 Tax=Vibrio makurazakiensis TaxID=2910250 RepID=UPI003D0E226C
MFNKILVVCMGNICRSPMGEGLLIKLLPDKKICSAGILTERSGLVGESAAQHAVDVAKLNGIELNTHKAKQLTEALCAQYDLILVMERDHVEQVCKIAPTARSKTLLFGQWLGDNLINDPYMKDRIAFEAAFEILERSAKSWVRRLS